ncbi:hypothetical protein DITRI_Ditri01bG0082300 [Diplodiscus trichospermus]
MKMRGGKKFGECFFDGRIGRSGGYRGEQWRDKQRASVGHSSNGGRLDWRASLFFVFVDRLGRKVSKGALWDAFGEYGKVMDVFISYSVRGNRIRNTTFAFVRYQHRSEMLKAIEKGNLRRIDGWVIRVKEPLYGWGAR